MLFQIKLNFFIIVVICFLDKVVIVSAGGSHHTSTISICKDPDKVVNSYRFKDDSDFLQEGSWLNYTCYLNHEAVSGSLNRQCQGGQYSGDPPVCIYTCGPAPNITDMLADIPPFSVDGTVLNYTCKHDNNIKMEAICSKFLNEWIYNYTVCPHPTNLMDNERLDTKFYDNDTNTCGPSGYGFSQEFGGGLVDATHIVLIFGQLDPVMGPITVALNGTTNRTCTDVWINPVSNGSFNVSCPSGTYGSILEISSNNNFTLCEVHVTGNYRNERCPGRTSFEKYVEVVSRDDTGILLRCIPGYYHQKGVNVVKCQEDLTWKRVYIKCLPERQLMKMVSNDSRLTDLDVNTCVTLPTGAIELLFQPSLGGRIVLRYLSVHLKDPASITSAETTAITNALTPTHPSTITTAASTTTTTTTTITQVPHSTTKTGPHITIDVTGLSGDPTVKCAQRPIGTLTGEGQLKQCDFKHYTEGDGVLITVNVPSTQTVEICEVYVYADLPKITSTELSTPELTATTDPSTITPAASTAIMNGLTPTDHASITTAASTTTTNGLTSTDPASITSAETTAITNALTPTHPSTITTAASTTTTTTTSITQVPHLTTTTEPTSQLNATDTCGCRCFTFSLKLLDDETTEDKISNITKFLSINKNGLSSKIRKRTSANDTRPSATYVGSFAIILFCIFFCLLVLPDLLKLLYHLKVMLKYGNINNIPYHK